MYIAKSRTSYEMYISNESPDKGAELYASSLLSPIVAGYETSSNATLTSENVRSVHVSGFGSSYVHSRLSMASG